MHAIVVFWPVLCVYWHWGQCVWALGEGSHFQLLRGLSSSTLDPNFCWKFCTLWSCPFIRTHSSEMATLEIPTLIRLVFTIKGEVMDAYNLSIP